MHYICWCLMIKLWLICYGKRTFEHIHHVSDFLRPFFFYFLLNGFSSFCCWMRNLTYCSYCEWGCLFPLCTYMIVFSIIWCCVCIDFICFCVILNQSKNLLCLSAGFPYSMYSCDYMFCWWGSTYCKSTQSFIRFSPFVGWSSSRWPCPLQIKTW